jgi:hypothetical protein
VRADDSSTNVCFAFEISPAQTQPQIDSFPHKHIQSAENSSKNIAIDFPCRFYARKKRKNRKTRTFSIKKSSSVYMQCFPLRILRTCVIEKL